MCLTYLHAGRLNTRIIVRLTAVFSVFLFLSSKGEGEHDFPNA